MLSMNEKPHLTLRSIPDRVLLMQARKIKKPTPYHRDVAKAMVDTMFHHSGVGLAANQVGILERICVIKTEAMDEPLVLLNPEIISRKGERDIVEACLSIPKAWGYTRRAEVVTVRAMGLDGKMFKVTGEGVLAQALEHEIDHLHGILYSSRMTKPDKGGEGDV